MDNKELELLHSLELKIALEIKRICELNNIKYSLSGGSLIGAVRHKGFIPWDDDMDIDMTRENYERFLDVCKTQLGKEFKLVNYHTDKNYWTGFSKVTLCDTEVIEAAAENSRCHFGIYVDIFPWDSVPNGKIAQIYHEKIIRLFVLVLLAKHSIRISNKSGFFKKTLYRFLHFFTQNISHEVLVDILEKNLCLYNNKKTYYYTCAVGVQGYQKNKIPAEWFKEYISLPFETENFSAIAKFHNLLSKSYGDYMKLPPEAERKSHNFITVNFGKYLER